MLRKLLIASIILIQFGCNMESEHIICSLREHLHHNIGGLIIEIGSPTASVQTQNANYYTWIKEAKKAGQVHGYHYKDPITNFVTTNMMENIFEQEPEEIIYECKLTVATNKEDIIISYHLSGRCNKRNTFINTKHSSRSEFQ